MARSLSSSSRACRLALPRRTTPVGIALRRRLQRNAVTAFISWKTLGALLLRDRPHRSTAAATSRAATSGRTGVTLQGSLLERPANLPAAFCWRNGGY